MDLLQAAWIPVRVDSSADRVSLQQLLCSDVRYQLRSHRDDFELATLQLLISLVQVLLPPTDRSELRQRVAEPLATERYREAAQSYQDWFQLDHSRHPFMQTRGVKAADVTPIQKLFIGLPEGNNHAFFNDRGEINRVCGVAPPLRCSIKLPTVRVSAAASRAVCAVAHRLPPSLLASIFEKQSG